MSVSIRYKAVFPVLLLAIMIIAITSSAFFVLSEVHDATQSLAERFEEIEHIRNIESEINNLIFPHASHITHYSEGTLRRVHEQFAHLDSTLKELSNMEVINKEEGELLEFVRIKLQGIKIVSAEILQTTPATHHHAMDMLQVLSNEHLRPLSQALRQYHVSELQQIHALRESAQNNIDSFLTGVFMLGIFAVVILSFTMWLNHRTLIRPILSLSQSASVLASGNLTQKADIYADDELGRLAQDLNHMGASLHEMYERLNDMATTDQLTGLQNRRAFEQTINRELKVSARYHKPLGIAVLDIDHFKRVNDTYGHMIGDKVLQHVAQLLQSTIRDTDYCFRFGGEEFVLILPYTEGDNSRIVTERCRTILEENAIEVDDHSIEVRASIGLACAPTHGTEVTPLLYRADKALYAAKNQGRNRVIAYEDLKESSTKE